MLKQLILWHSVTALVSHSICLNKEAGTVCMILIFTLSIHNLLTAVSSLLARDSSSFESAAHCFSRRLSLFCDNRFSIQINCGPYWHVHVCTWIYNMLHYQNFKLRQLL